MTDECRCLCSPCNHSDHCGGETCPHEADSDRCAWCSALIDDCLSDPCDGAAMAWEMEFGALEDIESRDGAL